MTTTIDYYNRNAEAFTKDTVEVDFTDTQDRFLSLLKEDACVLDFGCGAGRDTKYFLSKGLSVDACDGSVEMCRIASELTGIEVKEMLFSELDAVDIYDGIWACSSILHLPLAELKNVFLKMRDALKEHGVIYTSFKYGTFEGERNGRYFTDFTEDGFTSFMADIKGLSVEDYWISADIRKGRESEKWLNLILRKC